MSIGSQHWKDAMFRHHAPEFKRVLDARPVQVDVPGLRGLLPERGEPAPRLAVLDLGCGSGRLLSSLSTVGSIVVGLDYSPELLRLAAETVQPLRNVVLMQGDMRHLLAMLPGAQFQLIVRAYTSLGYFERSQELDILRACHALASSDARIVIDTFNAGWFRIHGRIERSSAVDGFLLQESYRWDDAACCVHCLWRYLVDEQVLHEIPFVLGGYALTDVDALLQEAGWQRERLVRDIGCLDPVPDSGGLERLVVVARKLSSSQA